jgi:hypothetical protein
MDIVNQSVVYKPIGAFELKIDVRWPRHATGLPVLLYLYGKGSPLQGSRSDVPPHMYNAIHTWGIPSSRQTTASLQQVGIQQSFDDVQDCIRFIRDPLGLASKLPRGAINSLRLAVSGSGGGGHLALLAGLYTVPKPQAVLALYPITDPLGTFFTISHGWDHRKPCVGIHMQDDRPLGYELLLCETYCIFLLLITVAVASIL